MKKSFYEEVNPRSQVFAEEEFDVLMDDFVDLKRQGKPLVGGTKEAHGICERKSRIV